MEEAENAEDKRRRGEDDGDGRGEGEKTEAVGREVSITKVLASSPMSTGDLRARGHHLGAPTRSASSTQRQSLMIEDLHKAFG